MDSLALKKNKFSLSPTQRELLINMICWLCLGLFAYTAYAKIIDHDRFYRGLTRVHLLNGFALFLAYSVPVAEIIVAFLLLVPQTAKSGLISFIALMTLFTVYIVCAMIWEEHLPCHCGGAIEKLSWMQHLWFNLAFILLAIVGLRLLKKSRTI